MAFGQGLSVNAMQAAACSRPSPTAASACRPRLVDGTVDADGTSTPAADADGDAGGLAPDGRQAGPRDAGGRRRPGGHRARGPDPGLPGRRQDRHRRPLRRQAGGYYRQSPRRSSASPRPTTRSSSSRSSCRSRSTGTSAACSPARCSSDVMTYALQELKIPPTGTDAARRIELTTTERGDSTVLTHGPSDRRSAAPTGRSRDRSSCVRGRAVDRPRGRGDPARSASPGSPSTRGAVRPGDLYAALPGARAHGADFAGAGGRGRRGRPCSPTPPGADADGAAGVGVPVLVVDEPRAVARRGRRRASTATRPTRLRMIGDHRHQRQDHDGLPGRGRAAAPAAAPPA